MAADQGSEDLVGAVCYDGVVVGVDVPVVIVVSSPTVVEVGFSGPPAIRLQCAEVSG